MRHRDLQEGGRRRVLALDVDMKIISQSPSTTSSRSVSLGPLLYHITNRNGLINDASYQLLKH